MYERLITFHHDSSLPETNITTVNVKCITPTLFDLIVQTPSSTKQFLSVQAQLSSNLAVSSTLDGNLLRTTVVPQQPHSALKSGERLHVFHQGQKTTLTVPTPSWLLALEVEEADTGKTSIKAPMPSLVVDVRVKVGDHVDKGQAIVVLESMKTETVLRANASGIVKTVACRKGEMVGEGHELVLVEGE